MNDKSAAAQKRGIFSRMWGGGPDAKKPTKAKLGTSNSMYFDEELKCWRDKGSDAPPPVTALQPPPKMGVVPATAGLQSDGSSNLDSGGSASGASATTAPLRSSLRSARSGVGSRYASAGFGGGSGSTGGGKGGFSVPTAGFTPPGRTPGTKVAFFTPPSVPPQSGEESATAFFHPNAAVLDDAGDISERRLSTDADAAGSATDEKSEQTQQSGGSALQSSSSSALFAAEAGTLTPTIPNKEPPAVAMFPTLSPTQSPKFASSGGGSSATSSLADRPGAPPSLAYAQHSEHAAARTESPLQGNCDLPDSNSYATQSEAIGSSAFDIEGGGIGALQPQMQPYPNSYEDDLEGGTFAFDPAELAADPDKGGMIYGAPPLEDERQPAAGATNAFDHAVDGSAHAIDLEGVGLHSYGDAASSLAEVMGQGYSREGDDPEAGGEYGSIDNTTAAKAECEWVEGGAGGTAELQLWAEQQEQELEGANAIEEAAVEYSLEEWAAYYREQGYPQEQVADWLASQPGDEAAASTAAVDTSDADTSAAAANTEAGAFIEAAGAADGNVSGDSQFDMGVPAEVLGVGGAAQHNATQPESLQAAAATAEWVAAPPGDERAGGYGGSAGFVTPRPIAGMEAANDEDDQPRPQPQAPLTQYFTPAAGAVQLQRLVASPVVAGSLGHVASLGSWFNPGGTSQASDTTGKMTGPLPWEDAAQGPDSPRSLLSHLPGTPGQLQLAEDIPQAPATRNWGDQGPSIEAQSEELRPPSSLASSSTHSCPDYLGNEALSRALSTPERMRPDHMWSVEALAPASRARTNLNRLGAAISEEDEVSSALESSAKVLFHPRPVNVANSTAEQDPNLRDPDQQPENDPGTCEDDLSAEVQEPHEEGLDTAVEEAHASHEEPYKGLDDDLCEGSDEEPYEAFDVPPAPSVNEVATDEPSHKGDSWQDDGPESVACHLRQPPAGSIEAEGDRSETGEVGWEEGSSDWPNDLNQLPGQRPAQLQEARGPQQLQPVDSQGSVTSAAAVAVDLSAEVLAKDDYSNTVGDLRPVIKIAGSGAADVMAGVAAAEEDVSVEHDGWDDGDGWDDMDPKAEVPSDSTLPSDGNLPALSHHTADQLAIHDSQDPQGDLQGDAAESLYPPPREEQQERQLDLAKARISDLEASLAAAAAEPAPSEAPPTSLPHSASLSAAASLESSSEVAALRARVEELERESEDASTAAMLLDDLEARVADLTAALESRSADNVALRDQIEHFRAASEPPIETAASEGGSEEAEERQRTCEELQRLQTEFEDTVADMQHLQDKSADLETQLQAAEAAQKESRAVEEASAAERQQLQETNRKLEAKNHALEQAGADAIAQRNIAAADAEEARAHREEATEKLAEASSRAAESERKLAIAEQSAEEAQAAAGAAFEAAGKDLAEVSRKLAEAAAERDEALRRAEVAEAAKGKLRRQLEAVEAEEQLRLEELDNSAAEISALKVQLSEAAMGSTSAAEAARKLAADREAVLEQQCRKLESQKEGLVRALQDGQAEIAGLQERLDAVAEKDSGSADLQQQLAASLAAVEELQATVTTHAAAEAKATAFANHVRRKLGGRLRDAEAAAAAAKAQLAEAQAADESAQADAAAHAEALQGKADSASAEVASTRASLAEVVSQRDSATSALREADRKLAESEEQLAQFKRDADDALGRLSTAEAAASEAARRADAAEAAGAQAAAAAAEAEQKLIGREAMAGERASAAAAEAAELRAGLDEAKASRDALMDELAAFEDADTQREALQAKVNDLAAQNEALQVRLDDVAAQNEALLGRLDNAAAHNEALTLQLQSLSSVAKGSSSAEAAMLKEQVEEQQREFNDLLACLGQESSKVAALMELLEGAGLTDQADALIAEVDAEQGFIGEADSEADPEAEAIGSEGDVGYKGSADRGGWQDEASGHDVAEESFGGNGDTLHGSPAAEAPAQQQEELVTHPGLDSTTSSNMQGSHPEATQLSDRWTGGNETAAEGGDYNEQVDHGNDAWGSGWTSPGSAAARDTAGTARNSAGADDQREGVPEGSRGDNATAAAAEDSHAAARDSAHSGGQPFTEAAWNSGHEFAGYGDEFDDSFEGAAPGWGNPVAEGHLHTTQLEGAEAGLPTSGGGNGGTEPLPPRHAFDSWSGHVAATEVQPNSQAQPRQQSKPGQQQQPRQQGHQGDDRDELFAAFSDDTQNESMVITTADDGGGWDHYDF